MARSPHLTLASHYLIQVLEAAAKALEPANKDKGAELNKRVLADLKALDKLAKASNKADVPEVSASLKKTVLDFVALEPERLVEKYGVSMGVSDL